MKKLLFSLITLIFTTTAFSQTTPQIGNPVAYKTIKRGDTLDVVFKYTPAASVDVRTFQVDFQYRKQLFSFSCFHHLNYFMLRIYYVFQFARIITVKI